METTCEGCSKPSSACPGLADPCRYRLMLAAAHKLLVVGSDASLTSRQRQRHRNIARARLRAILDAAGRGGREGWPAWARAVDAAVERRAA